MQCPSWLWNILLRHYWPQVFTHEGVAQGLAWTAQHCPDLPRSEESPIFVFSAGWRSGSTLLQRLLNSHPEVMVWGEAYEHSLMLHHLAAPLSSFSKVPLDMEFMPEEMAAPARCDKLAVRLTSEWTAVLAPAVADLKRAHWAYLEALLKTPAARLERPRWGIKMVRGTAMVAEYLRWLYPKAKFLYLYRDPYASFRSYKSRTKKGWYLYFPSHRVRGALPFAVHWRHCMGDFLASAKRLDALLVPYESLINRQILGALQDYIGLPLDTSILDAKVDISNNTSRPGAQRRVSIHERRIIQFVTGDLAARHGYTEKGMLLSARAAANPSEAGPP